MFWSSKHKTETHVLFGFQFLFRCSQYWRQTIVQRLVLISIINQFNNYSEFSSEIDLLQTVRRRLRIHGTQFEKYCRVELVSITSRIYYDLNAELLNARYTNQSKWHFNCFRNEICLNSVACKTSWRFLFYTCGKLKKIPLSPRRLISFEIHTRCTLTFRNLSVVLALMAHRYTIACSQLYRWRSTYF